MEGGSNNGVTCAKMKDGSCHTHSHKTFYLLGCYNVEAMVISKDLEALAQGRGEEKDKYFYSCSHVHSYVTGMSPFLKL